MFCWFLEDEVLVFGHNNLYTCTVGSRPRPLMSFQNNPVISATNLIHPASTIRRDNGVVVWSQGTEVYGYGRPNQSLSKTLFKLNTTPFGTRILSLYHDGTVLWGGVD